MKTSELFALLKEKAGGLTPPDGLACSVAVEVTGPDPARWRAEARESRLSLIEEDGAAAPADITVTLSGETAAGLYLKTANPLAAFMTGKIKVKGDAGKIALLKNIFMR